MITIDIDPTLLQFGHLAIRWYGLIVAAAVLVGFRVAALESVRRGLDRSVVSDAALWVVPGGLVGARLFHVLDHWSHEYAADPVRALYFWEGGLAIWGAVIGGLAVLVAYAWREKLAFGLLADIAAPGLVLAQGLGRLACVITGDAMGKPTSGPFGFAYSNPGAMVPQLGVYYTPTPVFELVMNLAIFALLWRLRRWRLPAGSLFLTYVVLYSAGRFIITMWSSYQIIAFGLNQAQLVSLLALALGLPWLIALVRRTLPSPTLPG